MSAAETQGYAPGVYDLTPEEYSQIPGANWSTLKHLLVSAKLLQWRADHPRADTAAFRLGRAVHVAVLEPDRWAAGYTWRPDFGDGRTKAAKEAKAAWLETLAPGTEILDAAEYDLVQQVAAAVYDHAEARRLVVGGRAEQCVIWTDTGTGLLCKARVDYLRPLEIVDVKTTRRQTVRAFERESSDLAYHGQLAYYHDGCIAAGALPPDAMRPCIVAPQTVEPYDVAAFRLTDRALEAGRSLWRSLIDRYASCREAQWYPGIAPGLLELDVLPWAAGADGYETTEDW